MKLLHYNEEPVLKLEERSYDQKEQRWQAKPVGLWLSVEEVESEDHNYNWKQWCEAEGYRLQTLKCAHEVILKEDANILHLKTAKEVFEFTKKYQLKTRELEADWHWDTYQITWDIVKQQYQGIIISPYQWDCRLAIESSWYYGWDCSSGCVWDLKCIESFTRIE